MRLVCEGIRVRRREGVKVVDLYLVSGCAHNRRTRLVYLCRCGEGGGQGDLVEGHRLPLRTLQATGCAAFACIVRHAITEMTIMNGRDGKHFIYKSKYTLKHLKLTGKCTATLWKS